jgi:hypothetical protein
LYVFTGLFGGCQWLEKHTASFLMAEVKMNTADFIETAAKSSVQRLWELSVP